MNSAIAWIVGIASSVLTGILIQYFYIPFRLAQALAIYEERSSAQDIHNNKQEKAIDALRAETKDFTGRIGYLEGRVNGREH